jgi:hypothetical protein
LIICAYACCRVKCRSSAYFATTDTVVGATDLDGNARRYSGGVADLGAYEFAGAPGEIFYIAARPQNQSVYIEKPATFTASSPNGQSTAFTWQYFNGSAWVDITTLPDWTVTVSGGTSILRHPGPVAGLQIRAVIVGSTAGQFAANLVVKARRILRVDTDVAGGDGLTWPGAYHDLEAAMTHSDEGTDIWIAEGDYHTTVYLTFVNGVRLYGGFAGAETALAQRDPADHPVVFRGDAGNGRTISVSGSLDRTTLIDGVTFTDSGSQYGVAVSNGANLTFHDVTFRDATRPPPCSPTPTPCSPPAASRTTPPSPSPSAATPPPPLRTPSS